MSRQTVKCVWCGWSGESPVKQILKTPGMDYPLECRACGAIGLVPLTDPDAARAPDRDAGKSPQRVRQRIRQGVLEL